MGKLSFYQSRFYFEADGGLAGKEALAASSAKLHWDADTLRWVTRSPLKAVGLRRWADESAERKFKTTFITDLPPPECVPYPDHLFPKTFQLESAWHCLTRTPAYCADEAGLGKTVVACLCMNAVLGKTLIICPPYLKYNWAREVEKWVSHHPYYADVSIIESGKASAKDELWDAGVVIVPDSLLTSPLVLSMIQARKWTWLFIDEAHRYKEATTQRTQALIGDGRGRNSIGQAASRIVLLSGTPIPNGRPIELYPLLSELAPESISYRSAIEYGKKFCGGKQVVRYEGRKALVAWDFTGHSNLSGLRSELRNKLMIRHLKRDVLKELGPKTRQMIFLDGTTSTITEYEKRLLKNFTLEELMGEDHELGDIAMYRREVGKAKILDATHFIMDLLEETGEKVLVAAHHIEVVEALHHALKDYHPLMIRGGLTAKEKDKRVRLFQESDKHRVVVGNIDSIGVGNTLTRAPIGVACEYSWSPSVNEQLEDRLHRITQEKNVLWKYLVLRGTLDERMLYKVLEKQEAITALMD